MYVSEYSIWWVLYWKLNMVSVIIELYRHSLISSLVVLLLLIPRPPMVWLRFHHRRGMNHLHRLRSIILRLGSVHRAITYIDQIPSSFALPSSQNIRSGRRSVPGVSFHGVAAAALHHRPLRSGYHTTTAPPSRAAAASTKSQKQNIRWYIFLLF